MTRTFNGTTDDITLSIGQCGFAINPGTIACIAYKKTDGSYQTFISTGVDENGWAFQVDNNNNLIFDNASGGSTGNVTMTVADGWCLVAITKESGATVIRTHRYIYNTGIWTHIDSSSTLTDLGVPSRFHLGDYGSAGIDGYTRRLLIAAVWNRVLTDIELEGMTDSLVKWIRMYPKGLWVLNQSSVNIPLEDVTGNGANQTSITGTSISSIADPAFAILGVPALRRKFSAVQGG